MSFRPMRTNDGSVTNARKTLLYAEAGWGKTTQAKHMQRRYGPGFIISGESGLASIASAGIDYLPFSSWDGPQDPDNGVYSFKGICALMATEEFKAAGYKWVMLDSLTEAADLCLAHWTAHHEAIAAKNGKGVNGWDLRSDYNAAIIGACKWLRDRPYHVVVTCLAKKDEDPNLGPSYRPLVSGRAVQQQLPGLFDQVFAGVRVSNGDRNNPRIERYIVTDEVRGYLGKARDERRRLRPVERCDDITKLLDLIEAESDEEAAAIRASMRPLPIDEEKAAA